MSTSDREPQTPEEQQADVERALGVRALKARPEPDARELLDRLLDGRPQLTALALNLVRAALESGAVVADSRPMTSFDITSTLRKGRRAQMLAERTAMIEREFPKHLWPMAQALSQLAETRKAGEKAVERTPLMIRRAKAEGMKPTDIARLLKVSDSHVYAVLRKPDQETTRVEALVAQFVGPMEQLEQDRYEARRAQVPEGRTLYTFRIELFDGPAGEGWQAWEEGDTDADPGTEAQVAADLLADAEEQNEEVRTHRARVLIWEGPEGAADDALYLHEREPGTE
ncbi:hypothetical protein [Streptomyces sp. CC224B]|uniref:hypothetical protein n=1 Tax=Streptomyces sp. CC224B TaxID=3044571 RepID=UPI0024A7A8AE|nr:hypothetical protein [Streptomyces sp. CC224B]